MEHDHAAGSTRTRQQLPIRDERHRHGRPTRRHLGTGSMVFLPDSTTRHHHHRSLHLYGFATGHAAAHPKAWHAGGLLLWPISPRTARYRSYFERRNDGGFTLLPKDPQGSQTKSGDCPYRRP